MREMWTMLLPKMSCDWVRIIYQKMGGHVSLIPQDCCRMNGVACFDGHVVGITWSYRGLNGNIPPEIGNLLYLKHLYELLKNI